MKRFLCVVGLAAVLGGCSEPTLLELAEQGDADAQFELGEMYSLGGGVAKDDAQAFKWYLKVNGISRQRSRGTERQRKFSVTQRIRAMQRPNLRLLIT